jgi:hypothetical protein
MEERKAILASGPRRASFVALIAYYVFALYLVPSTAIVERLSFTYFALIIPAWLYLAVNWRYLLTGYSTASKLLALFAVLAGISGVLRGDYPLAYNAGFLSAMAIVVLNSRVYLKIAELNWIFLSTVAGSLVVHVLGITEYSFVPLAKSGDCSDLMNWRVSLFRVTAESAMLSLVVLIANIAQRDLLRSWVQGMIILLAAYFLVFSGVRSIALAAMVTLAIYAFAVLKRFSAGERGLFVARLAAISVVIVSVPYLAGRGEGFWLEYFLRTQSCDYKIRYEIPGHPDGLVPKGHLPQPVKTSDWFASTLNRQCSMLHQLSLFAESPLGTRDIRPESDQHLSEVGCPPKQLKTYCSGCVFPTYWLARAGIVAFPLLLCFAVLMVGALRLRSAMLVVALLAFGIVSFSWGVMFVPYNFIFLIMVAMPAFVAAQENRAEVT